MVTADLMLGSKVELGQQWAVYWYIWLLDGYILCIYPVECIGHAFSVGRERHLEKRNEKVNILGAFFIYLKAYPFMDDDTYVFDIAKKGYGK